MSPQIRPDQCIASIRLFSGHLPLHPSPFLSPHLPLHPYTSHSIHIPLHFCPSLSFTSLSISAHSIPFTSLCPSHLPCIFHRVRSSSLPILLHPRPLLSLHLSLHSVLPSFSRPLPFCPTDLYSSLAPPRPAPSLASLIPKSPACPVVCPIHPLVSAHDSLSVAVSACHLSFTVPRHIQLLHVYSSFLSFLQGASSFTAFMLLSFACREMYILFICVFV